MNTLFDIRFVLFGLMLSIIFVVSSMFLVSLYEKRMLQTLEEVTSNSDLNWLNINVDGMRVSVSGTAPDEANGFKAISIINSIINSSLITNEIQVKRDIILPKLNYAFELLRDDDEITLVGFIPTEVKLEDLISDLTDISKNISINNLSEVVEYPFLKGRKAALNYLVKSLKILPNSKISLSGNEIFITALSDSFEHGELIREKLTASKPDFFDLKIIVESPRPLIQPFLFALTREKNRLNLIDCSSSDERSNALIFSALLRFDLEKKFNCEIGIGAPSNDWVEVITTVLSQMEAIQDFSLSIRNKEIVIEISDNVEVENFSNFKKELIQRLPQEYLLKISLRSGSEANEKDLNKFVAIKNLEGFVNLEGYLPNVATKLAVVSYARSLFGSEKINDKTAITTEPGEDWSIQILAGLEIMKLLKSGSLKIYPESLKIKGLSAEPNIENIARQFFADKIEKNILYELELEHDPNLIPKPEGANPFKCVSDINRAIKEYGIEFAPGEIVLQPSSDKTLEKIVEIMRTCYIIPMEIGGHTDSQGRKSLNLSISQARAEAVMDALLSYDILTGNLSAKGFGESTPIADNNTVEGRNKNRRIEFTLIEDQE